MSYILQKPDRVQHEKAYPLWVVLHGAYDHAEQALRIFGQEAKERNVFLLAPQASRPCGEGYCWSFAHDSGEIHELLIQILTNEQVDRKSISLIGFSMGCTMGCWVLAQHPGTFQVFAALSMGSAFEPWELDDGGIDLPALTRTSNFTRILLAVDEEDPYGSNGYFRANLEQFRCLGFNIETLRTRNGVHDITPEMKEFVFNHL